MQTFACIVLQHAARMTFGRGWVGAPGLGRWRVVARVHRMDGGPVDDPPVQQGDCHTRRFGIRRAPQTRPRLPRSPFGPLVRGVRRSADSRVPVTLESDSRDGLGPLAVERY